MPAARAGSCSRGRHRLLDAAEQPALDQPGPLVGRRGPHQVGGGVVGPAEPGDPAPEAAGLRVGAVGLEPLGAAAGAGPRRLGGLRVGRPRRRRAARSRPRCGSRPRRRRRGGPPPAPRRAGRGAARGHRRPARRCGRAGRRPPTARGSPPGGCGRGRAARRGSAARGRRRPSAGRRAPPGPARAGRSRAAPPRRGRRLPAPVRAAGSAAGWARSARGRGRARPPASLEVTVEP